MLHRGDTEEDVRGEVSDFRIQVSGSMFRRPVGHGHQALQLTCNAAGNLKRFALAMSCPEKS